MADVSFTNVDIRYPGAKEPTVKNLNLDIADGEFLVLVGPSGCGKSTSLRALAGLEKVSSGTITIGGRDVTDLEPADRDVAMVFQNYALYPHMTVAKNMGFALSLAKMPQKEIDERVARAADMLDLTEFLDRKPKDLSGVNAWPWGAPSSVSRRCSSWTSPSAISTRNCVSKPAPNSPTCSGGSAPQ